MLSACAAVVLVAKTSMPVFVASATSIPGGENQKGAAWLVGDVRFSTGLLAPNSVIILGPEQNTQPREKRKKKTLQAKAFLLLPLPSELLSECSAQQLSTFLLSLPNEGLVPVLEATARSRSLGAP